VAGDLPGDILRRVLVVSKLSYRSRLNGKSKLAGYPWNTGGRR